MSQKFRDWYFSRRGLILIPFFAVLAVCFWNESKKDIMVLTLGFMASCLGSLIRVWSMRYIGKYARKRNLTVKEIATTGVYAILRNPLYVGNMFIVSGFCIISGLLWYLPILLVILIVHYNIVVRCEENFLVEKFGDEYLQYKKDVPRWLPNFAGPKHFELAKQSWKDAFMQEARGIIIGIFGIIFLLLKRVIGDYIAKG